MNSKTSKYSVRVRLESNDYKILDESVEKLIKVIKDENMDLKGPIPLPTKEVRFTTRRAPSIYKNSFEKFGSKIHRRLIFINGIETVDRLKCIGSIVIPHVINIKINFIKS